MIIKFELDTRNINDIQLETLRRTIERSKHAHFTNIHLRINGHDQYEQADWLKFITEIPEHEDVESKLSLAVKKARGGDKPVGFKGYA